MSNDILMEKSDYILTITINRPRKKNAFNAGMYREYGKCIADGNEDPSIRVILVKPAGDFFCAGNDLADISNVAADTKPKDGESPSSLLVEQIIDSKKPLVAAAVGGAIGFGLSHLFHFDFVVAGQSGRFQTPFVKVGLLPELCLSYTLPRAVGHKKANNALILGDFFSAETAMDLGFVSHVVDDGTEIQKAEELAEFLATQLPPRNLRIALAMMKPPEWREKMKSVYREEHGEVRKALISEEHKEAASAFLEKRTADYSRFS